MKMEWEKTAPFAKPCPFCGSKNVVTEKKEHFYRGENKTCVYIECVDCGAEIYGNPVRESDGSFCGNYSVAYHEALTAWNRRNGK